MSQFTATKCDECQKVQGAANHWMQMEVWTCSQGSVVVGLGENADLMIGGSDMSSAKRQTRDLCGQACFLKHLAKLLGWSRPADAAQEERA